MRVAWMDGASAAGLGWPAWGRQGAWCGATTAALSASTMLSTRRAKMWRLGLRLGQHFQCRRRCAGSCQHQRCCGTAWCGEAALSQYTPIQMFEFERLNWLAAPGVARQLPGGHAAMDRPASIGEQKRDSRSVDLDIVRKRPRRGMRTGTLLEGRMETRTEATP